MTRLKVSNKPDKPAEEAQVVLPEPRNKREVKPIVARALTEEDKMTDPPAGKGRRRSGRKKSSKNDRVEWDQQKPSQSGNDNASVSWIIGGAVLGLVLAGIGAWIVAGNDGKDNEDEAANGAKLPAFTMGETVSREVELNEEEKQRQQEITESVKTGMNILAEAESVVKKFLDAESLEEMSKYVRSPEVTLPRMKAWYGDGSLEALGVKNVGVGGRVTVKGKMASMALQLDDFTYRHIALERVDEEYKVDWESWVIWSSVPWPDIFEKKPEEPVEVRVNCSLDSYYNRHFRDETKWLAVKLVHPYEDRTLYGYIDREDPSLTRLVSELQGRNNFAVTIKVKFPKNSAADNQVEIAEYVQNGWIRGIVIEK